eukprot:5606265-Amphidinium_carterae.1
MALYEKHPLTSRLQTSQRASQMTTSHASRVVCSSNSKSTRAGGRKVRAESACSMGNDSFSSDLP